MKSHLSTIVFYDLCLYHHQILYIALLREEMGCEQLTITTVGMIWDLGDKFILLLLSKQTEGQCGLQTSWGFAAPACRQPAYVLWCAVCGLRFMAIAWGGLVRARTWQVKGGIPLEVPGEGFSKISSVITTEGEPLETETRGIFVFLRVSVWERLGLVISINLRCSWYNQWGDRCTCHNVSDKSEIGK